MSKFVVVVFTGEEKAFEGSRVLQELHEEGSVSVVGAAVLVKDADGTVSTKEPEGPGPRGTVLGALLGGLVGLIGGPAGAVLGAAGGRSRAAGATSSTWAWPPTSSKRCPGS